MADRMIVLFTDFGAAGPYVGHMKAVLERQAPGVPRIDLLHDAPAHDPRASAYLLAALGAPFERGTVFLAVVDPGVGGERPPLIVAAGGRWYVGPGNGLFEIVMRRAREATMRRITWRPDRLSASFHGRDLFAPVAARLARDGVSAIAGEEVVNAEARVGAEWPDDVAEIIYIDAFGNAMTGLRAAAVPGDCAFAITDRNGGERLITRAATFRDVHEGQAFWYENAFGLVEIAINRGRADQALGLDIGAAIDATG